MANVGKVWNGTAWVDLGSTATFQSAGTATVGVVQLTDSTSSTSTTTAATPNSVKSAYDLAGTAIPKNTVTAAGDILYASGSATVTRLGIGTANQVLSVSGTVPAWTTPSAGAMTLISSTTVGTATQTVTLSSIPQNYKRIELYVTSLISSTATSAHLRMTFNNNTNADYGLQRLRGSGATADGSQSSAQTYLQIGSSTLLAVNTSVAKSFMIVQLLNYATSEAKTGLVMAARGASTNTMDFVNVTSIMSAGTASISSIEVFSSSATDLIAAGARFDLYGVS